MFQAIRQDPLLGITRGLLTILMWFFAAIGGIVLLIVPVILVMKDDVVTQLTVQGATASPGQALGVLVAILLTVVAMMACIFQFTRKLRAIVDTVATGDPFLPENADRLRAMAWLSIGLLLLAIPAGALSMWLENMAENAEANIDVSLGGILLPVVLFILARVFRKGAEMREELEGTV